MHARTRDDRNTARARHFDQTRLIASVWFWWWFAGNSCRSAADYRSSFRRSVTATRAADRADRAWTALWIAAARRRDHLNRAAVVLGEPFRLGCIHADRHEPIAGDDRHARCSYTAVVSRNPSSARRPRPSTVIGQSRTAFPCSRCRRFHRDRLPTVCTPRQGPG